MKTLVAAACALGLSVPVMAQNPDAAGRWQATFYTQDGPLPATMVLKKDGDKLAGTISSDMGEAPVSGEQKGVDLSLSIAADFGNGPVTITLTGRQSGDIITGTADVGGEMQLDWGAKRAGATGASEPPAEAEKPLDVSGTWGLEVTTQAGGGSPTITLQQKGEALTGRYAGQFGEAPLTGTLKGTAITFQFPVDVQGASVTVVYSGTVEKDAMKGTVRFGDMGEGTFTGPAASEPEAPRRGLSGSGRAGPYQCGA